LIGKYSGIPVYATNFQIIPFPEWKFCSGKMETLVCLPFFNMSECMTWMRKWLDGIFKHKKMENNQGNILFLDK